MPTLDRRTPLARALGSGSAKDGTAQWWAERVSSIALLVLGLWFVCGIAGLSASSGFGHAGVEEWLSRPLTAVLLLLLVASIAWHSDLGIRVVIEDYVHHPFVKAASLVVVRFLHVAVAVVSMFAILRMALR